MIVEFWSLNCKRIFKGFTFGMRYSVVMFLSVSFVKVFFKDITNNWGMTAMIDFIHEYCNQYL